MKLTHAETAHICQGLAVLLHGGIGAAEGIYLLAEDEDRDAAAMLERMGAHLDDGNSLSSAMDQTGAFPEHATAMVRIGEETGRLEEVLHALADYYTQLYRTTRQIKNALAYPCMILALLLVVIAVLMIQVLPVFDDVYASLGSRLTGVAAALLHAGSVLEMMLPALLVLCGILAIGALLFAQNARFRNGVAAWYLRRFGDRGINRRFNNARFARALAMGMGSGLPLDHAMALAQRLLSDNPGAAGRCGLCARMLDEGKSLSEAMNAAGLLTPAQVRVFSAGMRGGNADEVLAEMANRMQEDASDALESIVSRVEPAIVMAVSLLVGLILLSVMLPLMSIMSAIG